MTGPWDRSRWEDEERARGRVLEREQTRGGDEGKGVQIREEEIRGVY